MGIFDKLFGKPKAKSFFDKYEDKDKTQNNFNDLSLKHIKVKELYEAAFEMYYSTSCQCAFPRYQQIVGIDCFNFSSSFKCFDAEMLIGFSRPYFYIEKSDMKDEIKNEKWICKRCSSTYEYGWQDLSIAVEREKLALTELKLNSIGKPVLKPIPIYIGLRGHSYPSKSEITKVEYDEFKRYLMEKD